MRHPVENPSRWFQILAMFELPEDEGEVEEEEEDSSLVLLD